MNEEFPANFNLLVKGKGTKAFISFAQIYKSPTTDAQNRLMTTKYILHNDAPEFVTYAIGSLYLHNDCTVPTQSTY